MRRVRQAYSEAETEKSEARSQEPKARTAEAEARSQRLEARVQSEGTAIVFPSSEMGDCTRPSRKKSEAKGREPEAKTAEAESGQPSAASASGLSLRLELARTKSDRHGCSAEVKVQTFQCKGTDSVADSERREASSERRATACTVDGAFPVEPDPDFCQATRTDSDQVVEWTGALVDFAQEEETAADAASTQTPQAGVQNRRGARG